MAYEPLYYIYKIALTGTKYHYIGVTNNCKNRKKQHFRGIANMLNSICYNWKISDNDLSSYYYFVAYKIWETYQMPDKYHFFNYNDMEYFLSFEVVKQSKKLHIITAYETEYISIGGAYSLNKALTSNYAPKVKRIF